MMEESLPKSKRIPFTWHGANPFMLLYQALKYPAFAFFLIPCVISSVAEAVYGSLVSQAQRHHI